MILGLVTPTSGRVYVDGIDVHENREDAYRRVGAVLEGARNVYWRLSVRDNVRFFAGVQGENPDERRIDRLVETVSLGDKADEPVRTLSRGMKQKVALACALARNTPILFLDEPTLGLDVESAYELQAELKRLVADRNRTIVLSSHDMGVVEQLCDRVLIMDDGALIEDKAVESITEAYGGMNCSLELECPGRDRLKRALSGFEATVERVTDRRFAVDVVLDRRSDLYAVMSELESADATPVTVSAEGGRVEDVFLEATAEAGGVPR
jgi:ABC-2 type transport system ATP-binding protein